MPTNDTLDRARADWRLDNLLKAAEKVAKGWLVDEYENADLCMSPDHHAAIVALFDAIDDVKALTPREPSDGSTQTVGVAIQLAWSQHRDLPPIDLTDDEMRYLGEAAIAALSTNPQPEKHQ